MNYKKTIFYLIIAIFLAPIFSFSQTGTIRGFVYEESSEEAIIFANIFIEDTDLGAVSDDNGYFIVSDIPFGKYLINVSFIGYESFSLSIELDAQTPLITKKIFLKSSSVTLENVNVNAEREEMKTQVNTGVIKLTSKSISKLPSVGGEPDLAQYLQVIP